MTDVERRTGKIVDNIVDPRNYKPEDLVSIKAELVKVMSEAGITGDVLKTVKEQVKTTVADPGNVK